MGYDEAGVCFYSGTGNSYRVAAWISAAVAAAGTAVTLRSIGTARVSDEVGAGDTALLGLVMPTHGFTVPWAVLRFALRLPRRAGTHAIVVATRAGGRIGRVFTPGIEGTSTALTAAILALKGYRVRGVTGIDMPSNWIALHPGLSPGTAAEIAARARRKVSAFVGAILSGRRRLTGWIALLIGLCFVPVSLAYLLIGRLFLAKLFFATDHCTGCGLCARHCPNGAIRMKGPENRRRPYWTFRCESCMRCMAYCPTRAVEASHLLAVGAYALAALIPATAVLGWLIVRVPQLGFLGQVPAWVTESIWPVGIVGLVYPLLHLLLRTRWLNRLFAVTTPTHYYRRYHEPNTSLKDLQ
jgi:ferredoxin